MFVAYCCMRAMLDFDDSAITIPAGSSDGLVMRMPVVTSFCRSFMRPWSMSNALVAMAADVAVDTGRIVMSHRRQETLHGHVEGRQRLGRRLVGLLVLQHVGQLLVEVDPSDRVRGGVGGGLSGGCRGGRGGCPGCI